MTETVDDKKDNLEKSRMSFWEHLEELRWRLLKSIIILAVTTIIAYIFREQLLYILQHPVVLFPQLPHEVPELHVLKPLELIWVYLKLSIVAGIFLGFPLLFYQLWVFVSPGLYKKEKKYILPYCLGAWGCFIIGLLFAYFIIMPAVIAFLYTLTPDQVVSTWSVQYYVNLMLIMFLMFGLSFDLPVFFILLMKLGIVTPKGLASKRPYYIVGFFIISAIVTPTVDPITQTLMAGPMILLFEASILIGKFLKLEESS